MCIRDRCDSKGEESNLCSNPAEKLACEKSEGKCVVTYEGYYLESVACCILGFVWLAWGWKTVKRLQAVPVDDWRVVGKKNKSNDSKNKDTSS